MLLKTDGGIKSPLAEKEYRASPERMWTAERARLKSSGIPSNLRESGRSVTIEFTLTLDLKRRDTQKLKEGGADFLQGRMKDFPIHFAETKITFLEEEAAFESLKERKVPGKISTGLRPVSPRRTGHGHSQAHRSVQSPASSPKA